MIRWGLCCQFIDAPIKFRTATHRYVSGLSAAERREYLSAIALANAEALGAAVEQGQHVPSDPFPSDLCGSFADARAFVTHIKQVPRPSRLGPK